MPCLDFVEMRRRCGVTQGDLLVEIEKMSPERKQAAIDVITEMETGGQRKDGDHARYAAQTASILHVRAL